MKQAVAGRDRGYGKRTAMVGQGRCYAWSGRGLTYPPGLFGTLDEVTMECGMLGTGRRDEIHLRGQC